MMKKKYQLFAIILLLWIVGGLHAGCTLQLQGVQTTPTEDTQAASIEATAAQMTIPETTAPEETTETIMMPVMTPVLENITADTLEYYDSVAPGDFCVISKDGKYGLMDYSGNMILPMEYVNIDEDRALNDRMLFVKDANENFYIVASNGQLTQDPGGPGGGIEPMLYWYEDDYISFAPESGITYRGEGSAYEFEPRINQRDWSEDGIVPVQQITGTEPLNDWVCQPILKSEKFALLDLTTGKLLTDFIYEDFDNHNGFREGLLAVKKDGKWGYVDKAGAEVISCIYDGIVDEEWYTYGYSRRINAVVNGYVAVRQNGQYGLIDTQGNIVLDVTYEGVSQVNTDGLVWVKEDGSWTLYQLTK